MFEGGVHHASLNIIQDPLSSNPTDSIAEIELKPQTYTVPDEKSTLEELNETASNLESQTPKIPLQKPSDKLNLLMLFALYLTWGLIFGYFANALNVILIKKGADSKSLSQLTIMAYPFSLKFLFAPLVDNYYFKGFGKHKTYIIFSNYAICGFLVLNAFFIEDWIKNLEITNITAIGFVIALGLAFQSIAVDAWPPSLVRPENIRYVGFISNFGQMLGIVFAYNLFIWFNSRSFCNEYIYETYHENPVISSFDMLICCAVAIFIVTGVIHIFKKEEATPKKEFQNFREFLGTLSKFATNPNIRFLLFTTFFIGVGLQPVELGYVLILRKGFSQNTLSLVDMISNVVTPLVGVFASHLAKKKKEFTFILIVYGFNIVGNILYYFFVRNFESFDPKVAVFLYFLEDFNLGLCQTMKFVLFISFLLRVADPKMTAVYTTFFYSVMNLNGLWTVSISLLLIDYVDYLILCSVGGSFAILFLLIFGKKIRSMEDVEKKLWSITE